MLSNQAFFQTISDCFGTALNNTVLHSTPLVVWITHVPCVAFASLLPRACLSRAHSWLLMNSSSFDHLLGQGRPVINWGPVQNFIKKSTML
jgi:hypothetical protein